MSPNSPTPSSKAPFRTFPGNCNLRALFSPFLSAVLRSSQPMSPDNWPPFSEDWHSDLPLQTPGKPESEAASSTSSPNICSSASSRARVTFLLRTGSIAGFAPAACRSNICRTRILVTSSVFCRFAAGGPPLLPEDAEASSDATPLWSARRAQATPRGPLAPSCRIHLRCVMLAALGRPCSRCGAEAVKLLKPAPTASDTVSVSASSSPKLRQMVAVSSSTPGEHTTTL
mmetsp:Transcript_57414/g.186505  ORF Transcript_57414/g.186505 Transcript_57414/m.186505 type:complete len:229 (-) Transcript_57414:522-1208(-)